MNARKKKALEGIQKQIDKHLGHIITVGAPGQEQFLVVKDTKIINETVMIQVEGEYFPTIFFDSVKKCSCEKETTN